MNKSIAWLCLAAAALALSGCGGEPAKDGKPAAANKKGGKVEPNPWASDAAAGSAPAQAPKKKTAGKQEESADSPWAKEPPPGSQPTEPAKKSASKNTKQGEEEPSPWASGTPKPAAS